MAKRTNTKSMRPIPIALRAELSKLPRMYICLVCGSRKGVEWQHSILYRGRQINELYSIVGLCGVCHRGNFGTIFKKSKDLCEMRSIENGLEHLKINYPRFPWEQHLKYLKSIYESIKKSNSANV